MPTQNELQTLSGCLFQSTVRHTSSTETGDTNYAQREPKIANYDDLSFTTNVYSHINMDESRCMVFNLHVKHNAYKSKTKVLTVIAASIWNLDQQNIWQGKSILSLTLLRIAGTAI